MAGCTTVIDYVATGAMMQGIGTLIGAGAVIWAAFKAAATWKEQKRAERRLEMAEKILTATHKGRSALGYVRGVMMFAHELNGAEEKLKADLAWDDQTEGRKKRLITRQAYYDRLNKTRAEQDLLVDCLPMARALFSEKLEEAISELRHQFWTVQVYVDAYADDEHGEDQEFTKKIRRAMYDVSAPGEDKNEISDAIEQAVATIEAICVPALRLDPPGKPEAIVPAAQAE